MMKTKNAVIVSSLFLILGALSLPAVANTIPEGIFKFEGREHIYYSNGQGHYCYYVNWDSYVQLTGGGHKWRIQPGKLSQYQMTFDGICNGTPNSTPGPHPDPYF